MAEVVRKVCICGDPSVGKTSLVKRFVTGKYDDKYISTLGTVISKKSVKGPSGMGSLTMMLWDVSGQREFQRIHAAAFKNATAGFVVCDITRPDTISHLTEWVDNFREHAGLEAPVSVLLNKSDLESQESESAKVTKASLEKLGLSVYLTSAKTGVNVEEAFTEMAEEIIHKPILRIPEEPVKPTTNGVPEAFENPQVLLDYVMMRFCDLLGDHEMAMHIIRKQISDLKVEFHSMKLSHVRQLIVNLIPIIEESKGVEWATQLKLEFAKACSRCQG